MGVGTPTAMRMKVVTVFDESSFLKSATRDFSRIHLRLDRTGLCGNAGVAGPGRGFCD